VVELCAGTGPLTAQIQHRLGGPGRHLAIYVNPYLAERLHARYPGAEVIQQDAVHLRQLLEIRGIDRADIVISGLPWALFPAADGSWTRRPPCSGRQAPSPPSLTSTLSPRHSAHCFRDLLAGRFEEVVPSRAIWRNTPPAFVLHARGPRP
jgi:phosphatidylethanolamine/phosphatidyl-N-methylethanolamine N-methyltransferase